MQGGTFTITNGGVYGSLMSTPILNAPQSGILGMHKIQDRPVVVAGKVEIRPMMYLALSYDHRIVDGREAVTFLVRVKELLGGPGAAGAGFVMAALTGDEHLGRPVGDFAQRRFGCRGIRRRNFGLAAVVTGSLAGKVSQHPSGVGSTLARNRTVQSRRRTAQRSEAGSTPGCRLYLARGCD